MTALARDLALSAAPWTPRSPRPLTPVSWGPGCLSIYGCPSQTNLNFTSERRHVPPTQTPAHMSCLQVPGHFYLKDRQVISILLPFLCGFFKCSNANIRDPKLNMQEIKKWSCRRLLTRLSSGAVTALCGRPVSPLPSPSLLHTQGHHPAPYHLLTPAWGLPKAPPTWLCLECPVPASHSLHPPTHPDPPKPTCPIKASPPCGPHWRLLFWTQHWHLGHLIQHIIQSVIHLL